MTQAKIAKKTLNPIPSSLRGKKRYLLFEFKSASRIPKSAAESALLSALMRLYGSVGTAKIKPRLMRFNPKSGKGILRCSLEGFNEAKAGIIFVQECQNQGVSPRLLKASGSVKKLRPLLE
ncbi:MAG: Rpp14/Pop5 family protein [archaeon]